METRITRYKKKQINTMKKVKFLIGAVLLIGILGSGVSLAFAKQDVQSLLTNWFTSKREAAVEEIKGAIENERDIQIDRIKEQLQQEIQQASQYLDAFVSAEKDKRTSNLRSYADELINSIDINKSAGESNIQMEIDSIYEEAIREMEKAVQGGIPGNSPDVSDPQLTPAPETESESETDSDAEQVNNPKIEIEEETSLEIDTENDSESETGTETEIIQEPESQHEEGSNEGKGIDI